MSFQVTVILHGVPAGYKSFGKIDGQDKDYVQTFYNSNDWDEPEFLKVERVANKMFYTFIKCNNVNAYDGRSGSYLGITLRMNLYYADIQNIYSILKGVYKKLCIGTLVSDDGKRIQYIVSDFKDVGGKLEEYNKRIIDTISTFTSGSDLQTIGQVCNGKGTRCVNLMDCTESVAKEALAGSTSLKVSTYYASAADKRLRSEYDYKLSQAQQQYTHDMQKTESQYNEQIAELKRQLWQKESELQGGTKDLKDEVGRLKKELKVAKDSMQKDIDSEKAKLSQEKAEKQRILESLSGIINSSEYNKPDSEGMNAKQIGTRNSSNRKIALGRLVLLLVIILLLIVTNVLMWWQSSQLGQNLSTVNTRLDSLVASIQGKQASEQQDFVSSFNPDDWRIDIRKYEGSLKKGQKYNVAIVPKGNNESKDAVPKGDWKSDPRVQLTNNNIGKATLSVDEDFEGTTLRIEYVVNGKKVHRDVKVEQ